MLQQWLLSCIKSDKVWSTCLSISCEIFERLSYINIRLLKHNYKQLVSAQTVVKVIVQFPLAQLCTSVFLDSSSSWLADSYWITAVSTTWRHCRRSAASRQVEWTPVLKGWTSQDTILNHVSRERPLGLFHPAGGLLIAANTTLWWSSLYDPLARWPKTWSLLMRTNLEAAEHPVVLLTSAFVPWRVYGIRSILLWHHMSKASVLSESCLVTVQVLQQYSRTGSM